MEIFFLRDLFADVMSVHNRNITKISSIFRGSKDANFYDHFFQGYC